MTEKIIIILLLIALIYYYRQSQKPLAFTGNSLGKNLTELEQTKAANQTLVSFLRNNLNSGNLEELQTKLGSKTLDELIEENEDYETEVDTLTRTKNSLEQDLTAQAEAFQARLREKDREVKRAKEDLGNLEKIRGQLTSEKQQHKGSLERIKLLTEQITNLEQEKKKMPGQFPEVDLTKKHQEQLREIYSLFDLRAKGMKEIDFNQLVEVLKGVKNKLPRRNNYDKRSP